jgi:tetratricopeptide (TPR) repeat protein
MKFRENRFSLLLITIMLVTFARTVAAQTVDESLLSIESRWAAASQQSNAKQQVTSLKSLLRDARQLHEKHPQKAEAAVWHGIVARSFMDAKGSKGSSGIAREARDAFLSAESLNATIFGGLVYANLGALYTRASSKFGGFGNKTKGLGYFWKAIVTDPDGLDTNFLYAKMLLDEKDYESAHDALLRASNAPKHYLHSSADNARRMEIEELLATVEKRL